MGVKIAVSKKTMNSPPGISFSLVGCSKKFWGLTFFVGWGLGFEIWGLSFEDSHRRVRNGKDFDIYVCIQSFHSQLLWQLKHIWNR